MIERSTIPVKYFIFLLAIHFFCQAQISHSQTEAVRPKIGLALSGGGAKGFAHIGVLKVLEEIGMPIDYIAGTSMGAVVGALYSIGYSPATLDSLVTHLDWNELLTDSNERRYLTMVEKPWDARYIVSFRIRQRSVHLPVGLIAGQKISSLLSRLTWPVHHVNDFTQMPIPFACVAVDIETGETVRLTTGFLPEALRASMAIPTVFTPISLNKQMLVDGGLVRNLPADDVRALGAEIVIGIDVGAPLKKAEQLNSLLAILDQAVSLLAAHSTEKQREKCNVLIAPEFKKLGASDFDQAGEIIKLGEMAARKKLPQLLAILDTLKRSERTAFRKNSSPAHIDSIYVHDFTIDGLRRVSKGLVQAELAIESQKWVSAADLERAISRIYNSQFFERVTYKLQPSSKGTKLTVKVVEKEHDFFNIGFKYDSRNETAFLFNATFRNLTGHGSALAIDLILADTTKFDAAYFLHSGWRSGLGIRLHGNATESKLDRFDDSKHASRFKIRTFLGELFIGNIFSASNTFGFGLRGEISISSPDIAPPSFSKETSYVSSGYGLFQIDTFDRTVFPRKGLKLSLEFEMAETALGGNVDFRAMSLDWQTYFRLHSTLSCITRLQLGHIVSENLPIYKQFFLGGVDSFLGLRPQELAGKSLQALQVGLQLEFMRRRFVLLRWNVGNVFDSWRFNPGKDPYFTGAGITLGMQTRFGPLEYTYAFGNRHANLTHLNLGFNF